MKEIRPLIQERNFSDFDELTDALHAWNLELFKLDSAPFFGRIFQMLDKDVIVSHGYFSSRLKQRGEPPRGFRTFVVPADPSLKMVWRSQYVTGNDLLVFPEGGELHAFSEPGFDVYTVSVSEEALIRTAEQFGFQGVENKFKSSEVFHCLPSAISEMRRTLRLIEQEPSLKPNASLQVLADLALLLGTVVPGKERNRRVGGRLRVIRAVEHYILEHPYECSSMNELCGISGVSKRTIEYAFKTYLGISPKAYINSIRLNAVRKQLRAMKPGNILVADAANTWGFWHMGQFAADYRKLFGENPSATLQQGHQLTSSVPRPQA